MEVAFDQRVMVWVVVYVVEADEAVFDSVGCFVLSRPRQLLSLQIQPPFDPSSFGACRSKPVIQHNSSNRRTCTSVRKGPLLGNTVR